MCFKVWIVHELDCTSLCKCWLLGTDFSRYVSSEKREAYWVERQHWRWRFLLRDAKRLMLKHDAIQQAMWCGNAAVWVQALSFNEHGRWIHTRSNGWYETWRSANHTAINFVNVLKTRKLNFGQKVCFMQDHAPHKFSFDFKI
jgi:hypothetical protein